MHPGHDIIETDFKFLSVIKLLNLFIFKYFIQIEQLFYADLAPTNNCCVIRLTVEQTLTCLRWNRRTCFGVSFPESDAFFGSPGPSTSTLPHPRTSECPSPECPGPTGRGTFPRLSQRSSDNFPPVLPQSPMHQNRSNPPRLLLLPPVSPWWWSLWRKDSLQGSGGRTPLPPSPTCPPLLWWRKSTVPLPSLSLFETKKTTWNAFQA